MPSAEGLAARRAALQMLDAVLRRGQTLDAAAQAARGLPPADQALAIAIAGEALRRLPDLDALIDSATQQRAARRQQGADGAAPRARPEDRPRHARPCAGRDRPAAGRRRAAPAGPRRARHAAAPRRARSSTRRACPERSSSAGARRGARRWCMAARRAIAQRPPLDLSFADDARPQGLCRSARRHVARAAPCPRSPMPARSPSLPASATAAGGSRTSPPRSRRG